jgi:predicted metallopeptidase
MIAGDDILQRAPFVLEWGRHCPLPMRDVRPMGHRTKAGLPLGAVAPPWFVTGPVDQPFNLSQAIRDLAEAVCRQCPDLNHIDVKRIIFAFTQARNSRAHGLQARVTPLRFRDGHLNRRYRGVEYRVQRFRVDGREMHYVMTFCLPRFLDQDFDQKFITLFHELYHISPSFNGDLRRHSGRYSVHTHSQHEYDELMAQMAREYLSSRPDPDRHAFLRLSFAQLLGRHGRVVGVVVPRPKLLPVTRFVR